MFSVWAKYKETFKKPDVKCTIQEAIKAYYEGKTVYCKDINGKIVNRGKPITNAEIAIKATEVNGEWYIRP